VLEGRHVIGLFMLMLLFSGLFFTLGYVMGRDGQVRAATNLRGFSDVQPKPEVAPKPSNKKSAPEPSSAVDAASKNPEWEFYHAGDSNKTDDHLKPVAAPSTNPPATPAVGRSGNPSKQPSTITKTIGVTPPNAGGGINLQVAALTKEADAMALANTLRKKNFPTFVQSPQGDKYYHVLVGPYADQKAVDNARKGLEVAGFKAIVKH